MSIKYLNSGGLSYLWGKITTLLAGKVDTEQGKGLSEENYTSSEKSKLSNIDSYASSENRVNRFCGETGEVGIWAGSLFMRDGNGTYQNICTASDGTVTSSNRTTEATKIRNTCGFEVGSPIWYSDAYVDANTAITSARVIYTAKSTPFDARYSFNVVASNNTSGSNALTPNKPIYLAGTIRSSDGLFQLLNNVWWTQTPNTSNGVYILVGNVYSTSSSTVQIVLYEDNPWYIRSGHELIPYFEYKLSQKVNKDGDKVLSTNDYTTAEKTKLAGLSNSTLVVEDTESGIVLFNETPGSTALLVDNTLTVEGKVADAKAVGDKLSAVSDSIADEYDSTSAYAVGNYCIYNNALYRCNTAIASGGETWTSGHWTAVSAGDELSSINDALNGLPTEATAQNLLEQETYNTGLTDTVLNVIGVLFTNLPQDETVTDILHSIELECERLDIIYNNWITEGGNT